MFNYHRCLNLFFLLGISCFSIAKEKSVSPQQSALKNALSDLVIRSKKVTQSDQLSYREQLKDNNGNVLSRYYDASLPQGERWQQVKTSGKDISQSQLQISIPIMLSPSLLDQVQPELYAENEKFWIFAINTSINAENGDRQSRDLEEATSKLQSNLNTFIYIDKQTQQFTRLKIVNSTPFKPSVLAKIEVFSIIVDYAEAWQAGPLVAVYSVKKLKGSYGLFMEIDQQLTQKLSQYSNK